MSFNTDQSGEQDQTQDQSVTFNVGDRQYDAESATKKITAADEHIQRLEAERAEEKAKIAELEAQLAASTKLDDALQKLQAQNLESHSKEDTPTFDMESLKKSATEAALQALQQEKEENAKQEAELLKRKTFIETQKKLAGMYGNQIDEAVQKVGLSVEKAMKMAENPEDSTILLQLMQVVPATPTLNPSGGHTVTTDSSEQKIFERPPKTVRDIQDAIRRLSKG